MRSTKARTAICSLAVLSWLLSVTAVESQELKHPDWHPGGRQLIAEGSVAGTMPDNWEEEDQAPDWTVALTDSAGVTASLPLSHDSLLFPQVNAIPGRAGFLDATETTGVLFRRIEFPVADFIANSQIDAASTTQISFVFDRSRKGAIIIDDLSTTNDAR